MDLDLQVSKLNLEIGSIWIFIYFFILIVIGNEPFWDSLVKSLVALFFWIIISLFINLFTDHEKK